MLIDTFFPILIVRVLFFSDFFPILNVNPKVDNIWYPMNYYITLMIFYLVYAFTMVLLYLCFVYVSVSILTGTIYSWLVSC